MPTWERSFSVLIGLCSRARNSPTLGEGLCNHLARITGTHQYRAGEVIIRQGEKGHHLSVIASGRVEVQRERPDREPLVIDELGPGLFFGEMALLDDRPRTATVVALEDTVCLTLWGGHFRVQMEAHPELAPALLPEISRRWRQAVERLAAIA